MRKEYWTAVWLKVAIPINALMFISVGVLLIVTGKMIGAWDIFFMTIFILAFGLFFLIHAIVIFKWPVFIIEDKGLYYRGLFGILYVFPDLEQYFVEQANNGMYLYDMQKRKYGLRTGFLTTKKHNELYKDILSLCKPFQKNSR